MKYLPFALLSLFLLCSCATVSYDTDLPPQQISSPAATGKTKVVFFNDSNKVLYADGSWRIGIKIDGKGVANIHFNQYVQLDLLPGLHSLELSHVDLFTFRDEYKLEVTDGPMYIKVYNGLISTKFQILQYKPSGFENIFRPVI